MHIKEKMHEIKAAVKRVQVLKNLLNGRNLTFVFMLLLMVGTFYVVKMKKVVTISVDGKEQQVSTLRSDLKSLLSDKNIVLDPKDIVSPSLDSKIVSGEAITITRAYNISVNVDGKTLKLKSNKNTVGEMLQQVGIVINTGDKLSVSEDATIDDGFSMNIVRVDTRTIVEKATVAYATVSKKDVTMVKGKTKVVNQGQAGEKQLSFEVVYENGKEVARKLVSTIVTIKPIDKVVAIGTLGTISVPHRGSDVVYKDSFAVEASAYTNNYASTGKSPGSSGYGRTATGAMTVRNPSGYSTIAVDPDVIPYGTRLYIPGYGLAIAADTGGAIRGRKIDLFYNSERECVNWGRRTVTVYILK